MALRYRIVLKLLKGGMQLSLGIALGVVLYDRFLSTSLLQWIMDNVRIDVGLLMRISFYVFIGGSTSMILLVYWVFWENKRMRSIYKKYLSKLVAENYYEGRKDLELKQAIDGLTRGPSRKLDPGFIDQKDIPGARIERVYYEDGTIEKELSYRDDIPDGPHRLYYQGGQLKREAHYRRGALHGLLRTYYPDGRIHQEKEYKEGKLHGVFRAFDEDGILFFEIQYEDNVQNGFDKIYYKNGLIEYWDTYHQGVRINRKTYNERGELKFDQDFE